MSYLVIYTQHEIDPVRGMYSSIKYEKIDNLEDINKLNVDTIISIYEIAREVSFNTEFKEEEKIIQKKPYYKIDGSIEVDIDKRGYDRRTQEQSLRDLHRSIIELHSLKDPFNGKF